MSRLAMVQLAIIFILIFVIAFADLQKDSSKAQQMEGVFGNMDATSTAILLVGIPFLVLHSVHVSHQMSN